MNHLEINFEITQLINNLFAYEPCVTRQDEIRMIPVSRNCSLQMHVYFSEYRDSCAIFSLWYAVERLLYPERDPAKTLMNMETYLTKTSPAHTIKNIIMSFMMLININDSGIINNKKSIDKSTLVKIIGGRNKTTKTKTKTPKHTRNKSICSCKLNKNSKTKRHR